jgi:hypothetical protein
VIIPFTGGLRRPAMRSFAPSGLIYVIIPFTGGLRRPAMRSFAPLGLLKASFSTEHFLILFCFFYAFSSIFTSFLCFFFLLFFSVAKKRYIFVMLGILENGVIFIHFTPNIADKRL